MPVSQVGVSALNPFLFLIPCPLNAPLSRAHAIPKPVLTRWQRLAKQLEDLEVPFVDDFQTALGQTDHIVDAIFGW